MDKFVSGAILTHGAWEKNIVNLVLKGMDMYPAAVFLDIGANIGMYTVLVAAARREAVAVDAMLENLAYINQSLSVAGTSDYVRLLGNPVRYSHVYGFACFITLSTCISVTVWRHCTL